MITIWCDASWCPKTYLGVWAYRRGDEVKYRAGLVYCCTPQEAELIAIKKALYRANWRVHKCTVYTDQKPKLAALKQMYPGVIFKFTKSHSVNLNHNLTDRVCKSILRGNR